MNSAAIPASGEIFYSQGGVQVLLGGETPLLTYQSHGHEIRRSLKPGKPLRGKGEFSEGDTGLQVFYDAAWESWIIIHTRPHTAGESAQEWWTDTIYIPDRGAPSIKPGFSPAEPGTSIWRRSMAFLLIGTIVVAIGFWILLVFGVGHS